MCDISCAMRFEQSFPNTMRSSAVSAQAGEVVSEIYSAATGSPTHDEAKSRRGVGSQLTKGQRGRQNSAQRTRVNSRRRPCRETQGES